MSIQAHSNEATQTQAPDARDISSPDLSFAEYVQARREGTVSKSDQPSEPEVKSLPEQNDSTESETEEKQAKEDDKDESEVEGDELETEDSEKEKPTKKKGGFHRRIGKLTAEKTAAQQEAEYWKKLALKQGAGEPKEAEKVETPKADVNGKPDPDSFETHAEYVEALTDWKIEQRERAAKEQAQKSQLETEHQKQMKAHAERVQAFKVKTTDFDDVLADVDDVHVSPAVAELIIASENGPDLMYELAKNREEYERINSLPPLAAAREIGRIETKLAAQIQESKKPEPKKLTNAPKPIEPVGSGKGHAAKSLDDPNLPFADYVRLRREQTKKRQA